MMHAKLEPCLSKLLVESYDGEMSSDGCYHGKGVVTLKGGQVYEGMLTDGMMHGKGKYTWTDGTVYEGDFDRNVIVGNGIYKWPDGSVYEGSVENGLRHGLGTFETKRNDGATSYRGEWADGMRHGAGTMRYRNDSEYVGEFRRNKRCGNGKMSYVSGGVYEGSFVDDVKSGRGKMTWQEEIYDGEWQDDKQNGSGTHIWKSHAPTGEKRQVSIIQRQMYNRYVGEWRDGLRHGVGTFFYANGARYSGDWVHGVKHGCGVFIQENGSMSAGKFVEDRMISNDDKDKNEQQFLYMHLDDILIPCSGNATTRDTETLSLRKAIMRLNSELKSIYQAYACGVDDSIFTMSTKQFWRFCNLIKVIPNLMSIASVNAMLLAMRRQHFVAVETARLRITNEEGALEAPYVDRDEITAQRLETQSPARPILYREFVEAVVRLAHATSSAKSTKSLSATFQDFMKIHVIPHAMAENTSSSEAIDDSNSASAIPEEFLRNVEKACQSLVSTFGTVTLAPVVLFAAELFETERSETAARVAQAYADMRGGAANDLCFMAALEVEVVEMAEILARVASNDVTLDIFSVDEARLLECARTAAQQLEIDSKKEERPTFVLEDRWRPYIEAMTVTLEPPADDGETLQQN